MDREVLDYIGSVEQIAGMKRYTLLDGKAKGVEAIDVDNGSGLQFTILVDRCMDIYSLKFKGKSCAFLSPAGIVAPAYYCDRDDEWLRSFCGGFLTTCGFTQVGEPCKFEGTAYGLHGPASNLPAQLTKTVQRWTEDSFIMTAEGRIEQAKQSIEHIVLERSITCKSGENRIVIRDTITNEGSKPRPLMLLYHMNFGYPLLNPNCDVVIPTKSVKGFDSYAQEHLEQQYNMPAPSSDFQHLVYLHTPYQTEDHSACFMVADHKEQPTFAVYVKYPASILPTLGQWVFAEKRDYVMALEPCNNHINGVAYEDEQGSLKRICPNEQVEIAIELYFLDDSDDIMRKRNALKTMALRV